MQYQYSANLYEYDVYQFKGLSVMERQNNKEKKFEVHSHFPDESRDQELSNLPSALPNDHRGMSLRDGMVWVKAESGAA